MIAAWACAIAGIALGALACLAVVCRSQHWKEP